MSEITKYRYVHQEIFSSQCNARAQFLSLSKGIEVKSLRRCQHMPAFKTRRLSNCFILRGQAVSTRYQQLYIEEVSGLKLLFLSEVLVLVYGQVPYDSDLLRQGKIKIHWECQSKVSCLP